MSLKIFGGPNGAPEKKKSGSFADDVVGRFRSGYVANKRPVALSEWRVTTGDPEVADKVASILDGDEPQEWDATGEDNLEVFTKAAEVDVILAGKNPLRQAMVLYGRKGILRVSDGETISYPEDQKGDPDPQAGQTLAERKEAAREGTGSEPRIEVYFRLADDPDLGIFKFQTGSWSMVSDLAYNETEEQIEEILADGGEVRATLALEEVSFTAKSGPRAGQTVTYTKPVLTIKGEA
jgi:hypothetical protein